MTAADSVRSDVVDISTDAPRRGEHFYVDTCVWLWFAYPPLSLSNREKTQMRPYLRYLDGARRVGACLRSSAINLTELASVVERKEYLCHAAIEMLDTNSYKLKDFRHDAKHRERVAGVIESAWATIVTAATLMPMRADITELCSLAAGFHRHSADGDDALAAAGIREAGITQVITDDADFLTLEGLTVFTANRAAIGRAQAGGRLIQRARITASAGNAAQARR